MGEPDADGLDVRLFQGPELGEADFLFPCTAALEAFDFQSRKVPGSEFHHVPCTADAFDIDADLAAAGDRAGYEAVSMRQVESETDPREPLRKRRLAVRVLDELPLLGRDAAVGRQFLTEERVGGDVRAPIAIEHEAGRALTLVGRERQHGSFLLGPGHGVRGPIPDAHTIWLEHCGSGAHQVGHLTVIALEPISQVYVVFAFRRTVVKSG